MAGKMDDALLCWMYDVVDIFASRQAFGDGLIIPDWIVYLTPRAASIISYR